MTTTDAQLMTPTRMAARLRFLRGQRDLTQLEVAEAAGVSKNTVYNAESGARRTDIDTLSRLAGVFEVPLPRLLDPAPLPYEPEDE